MKTKNTPKHIAIIPDGNRRWAKKRRLSPWKGHYQGAKTFEKVLERAIELNIPYITFWGGSWDNLTRRPKREVSFLVRIYNQQFKRLSEDKRVRENRVKIKALGRWKEILPKKTQKIIKQVIEKTKDYNNFFLTFLLAYNGTDEIVECVRKIVKACNPKPIKVSEKTIKENLWTRRLPPVDLVIRTGCENDPHNSTGFMMWHTAYSQFHFTKTLFPDFKPKEFDKIIKDYSKRERRLGV